MIAEAVDTATLIITGAVVCAGVLGGAVTLLLLVLIAWAVKRARRTVRRPSWARGTVPAWLIARARRKRADRSASATYREAA